MATSATQLSDEQLVPPSGAGFVGFFGGWGSGSSSMSLGPSALMSLLEVNEEGPDFLGVHSDDGASW